MPSSKGKTISEKILSSKSRTNSYAGDIVDAEVDYVMVNDVTGPIAFKEFEGLGCELHQQKVVLVPVVPSATLPMSATSACGMPR